MKLADSYVYDLNKMLIRNKCISYLMTGAREVVY